MLPSALYLLVSSKDVLVDSNSERVVLWWHTAQELQKLGLTLTDDRFLIQPKGEQLSLLVNGGSETAISRTLFNHATHKILNF